MVDIETPGGRARWQSFGMPVLPTLVLDGRSHSLMHPSQAASLLGIAVEPKLEAVRVGWELHTLLEAWIGLVSRVPWPPMHEPTPSRERTILDLAVGSFFRVQFLAEVLPDHTFQWDPKQDRTNEAAVESTLAGTDDLVAYLEQIRGAWQRYLLDEEEAMTTSARATIVTVRHGEVEYATLIATVRDHAAQHYRQATTYLDETGRAVEVPFRLDSIRDLCLPDQIY